MNNYSIFLHKTIRCIFYILAIVVFAVHVGCTTQKKVVKVAGNKPEISLETAKETGIYEGKTEVEDSRAEQNVSPETKQKETKKNNEEATEALHDKKHEVIQQKAIVVTEETLKCIQCHKNRGVAYDDITRWEKSRHARKGIGCEVCHVNPFLESREEVGETSGNRFFNKGFCEDKNVYRSVLPGICGKCHTEQFNEFKKSRHARSWEGVIEFGKHLPLSEQTLSAKCASCHRIQSRCDSCHTRHQFQSRVVQSPDACKTCHRGADHPQYEMYYSSLHGIVSAAAQREVPGNSESENIAYMPVCTTCHMPEGNHDVSYGIVHQYTDDKLSGIIEKGTGVDITRKKRIRKDMAKVCTSCHSPNFANEKLDTVDNLRKEIVQVTEEAQEIIRQLAMDGLIFSVFEKIGRFVPWHAFAFSDSQFYEGTSEIEKLFIKMCKKTAVNAWNGLCHSSTDYTYVSQLQKEFLELKKLDKEIRTQSEIERKMQRKLR